MYERILIAVDGSKNAVRAAEQAAIVVRSMPEAYIEVLYVVDSKTERSDVLQAHDKYELEERRKQLLAPVTDTLERANLQYSTKILHGDAATTIVEHARLGQFELIVIGSRGLNAFQEMVLGSVSSRVVKQAKCPVLLVK